MKFRKILTFVLCLVLLSVSFNCVPASAGKTASQLQQQIEKLEKEEKDLENKLKELKNDKKKQQELKATLEKKISNLEQQIDACNDKIDANNKIIAKNEVEIAEKEAEMEQVIFEFKRRIRAIYMSGGNVAGIEVLLGAEDFADFIALSQLTENISNRDKKMLDEIVGELKGIQDKIAQNQVLIEEQKNIKATLKVKQDALDKECAEVLKVISDIQKNQSSVNSQLSQTEQEIKKAEEALEEILQSGNNDGMNVPFNGKFTWPCPGYTNITSGYGYRWGKLHKGIDIAKSGISGKKVVAAASGTVTIGCNTCTHNYGKVNSNGTAYSCKCGSYGNYVMIDHGKYNGKYYRTVYAHLKPNSIVVKNGQKVNMGQKIAAVGTTGNSTGYHLHFEIRTGTSKNSLSPINPKNFF